MSNIEFSVIIPFYNSELYLSDAIESIINQTLNFDDQIQLILIDDGSNDNSLNIAKDYVKRYPENIEIYSQEHKGVGSARNLALEHISGNYICFLDSDDKLSNNTLKNVKDAFLQYDTDVVAVPVAFFGRIARDPKKFSLTGVIDLEKHPDRYLASCSSSFFKKSAIGNNKFDENLVCSEENVFLNKILLKSNKYVYIDNSVYYYRRRLNYTAIRDNILLKKEYYNFRIKNYFIELIDFAKSIHGRVPDFINFLIFKHFQDILLNKDILDVIDNNDVLDIFKDLKYILSNVDVDLLYKIPIDKHLIGFLIAVKNDDIVEENIKLNKPSNSVKIKNYDSNFMLLSHNDVIDDLGRENIFLDFVTLRDNVLSFSGYIKTCFNKNNIEIFAFKEYSNGKHEEYFATYFDYPTRHIQKILSLDWSFFCNFDLDIPIKDKKEISSIKLKLHYHHNNEVITYNPNIFLGNFAIFLMKAIIM